MTSSARARSASKCALSPLACSRNFLVKALQSSTSVVESSSAEADRVFGGEIGVPVFGDGEYLPLCFGKFGKCDGGTLRGMLADAIVQNLRSTSSTEIEPEGRNVS